jgi:serine/threonine protein phosphatase PrpC
MNPLLWARGSLITNRGTKRTNNEDSCLFNRAFSKTNLDAPVDVQCDGDDWIIAIADGLGGQKGGERASAEVVNALLVYRTATPSSVSEALSRLNERLVEIARSENEYAGLGATVAGIACGDEGLFAFNVGDSRVYKRQDRFLAQITQDDCASGMLANGTRASEEHGEKDSSRRLTQAVGGRSELRPIDTHIHHLELTQPCLFLICSDGLTDTLSLDRMEELVTRSNGPNDAVQTLFSAAYEIGCNDNVSIIIAEVSSKEFEAARITTLCPSF